MRKKILVLGDTCIDRYFDLTEKPNPENPALKAYSTTLTKKADGMSGNVAKGLISLGYEITTPMRHRYGRRAEETTKDRYYINSEYQFRIDTDMEQVELNAMNIASELADENFTPDAIVISDYCKGSVSVGLINILANLFFVPIFLDTKKKNIHEIDSRVLIKVNEQEAQLQQEPTLIPKGTVVTLGAHGAFIKGSDKLYSAPKIDNVVDVCGAGDSFLCGYVHGHLEYSDAQLGVIHGLVAGSICVKHRGVYNVQLQELKTGVLNYLTKGTINV